MSRFKGIYADIERLHAMITPEMRRDVYLIDLGEFFEMQSQVFLLASRKLNSKTGFFEKLRIKRLAKRFGVFEKPRV